MDIFKPIQLFADLVTYQWFRIIPHSYLGDTINFFVYDTIKIGLLLIVINYLWLLPVTTFPWRKYGIF